MVSFYAYSAESTQQKIKEMISTKMTSEEIIILSPRATVSFLSFVLSF